MARDKKIEEAAFAAKWAEAKEARDAALAAAWEIPDTEDRMAALEAAREAWAKDKARLLK